MQQPAFPYAALADAVARQNRGDLAGAQAAYWRILLDQPRQFDALHLLGVSLCQQGRQAEGVWFIERALELRPEDVGAQFNRATALSALHRHAAAVAGFDRVVAARPDHAQAWSGRADSLQTIGRHAEAIESYRRALSASQASGAPAMPGTLANLGLALIATGQAEEAVGLFRQALAAGAEVAPVQVGIGRAEQELGHAEAARAAFDAAVAASPDGVQARWLRALGVLPDVAESEAAVDASRPAFLAALDEIEAWFATDDGLRRDRLEHAWPFFLAYQDRDNRAMLARLGSLRARLVGEWRRTQVRPDGHSDVADMPGHEPANSPLRVAIVSPHLYSHSVWHAITRGWFQHHDPARIVLHGFHTGAKSDAETAFAQERAASFTVGDRAVAAWAEAILAVRPHVVVYPAIGMDVTCGNLAALRLAPVQVACWGHPETTGLPTIDAYLSADAFEPAEGDAAYTERLIRLPRLGVAVANRSAAPVEPDLAALGLDPSRPLLLCPGTPFKYAPGADAALVAIARAVPAVQFAFFHAKTGSPQSQRLQARLGRAFAAAGLDAGWHCRLLPFQPAAAFHGLLGRADACLDTIGFSGFNTALHALQSGAVLVGFEGRFMRGRLGSGILRQMGLHELVAGSHEAYAAIAVRLVTDRAWRDAMRERIRQRLPRLYDDRGTVMAWMDELERLVRQSCASKESTSKDTAETRPPNHAGASLRGRLP